MVQSKRGTRGWILVSLTAIVWFGGWAAPGCPAQEARDPVQLGDAFPSPERATGEIADVVVFKNRYAFVRRYYLLKEGDSLRIGEVPNAVFGTFFALADPDKGEVTSVTAEFVEAQREVDCLDMRDIILANVGKRMRFTLKSGSGATLTGVLQKVLVQGGEAENGSSTSATDREETVTYSTWYPYRGFYPWWEPYWSSGTATRSVSSVYSPATPRPAAVVHYALQTSDGLAIIDSADVGSVLVCDEKPEMTFTMKGKAKQLTVAVKRKKSGPVVVAVVYLVQGMNWFPSYRLNLSGEDEAQMVMTGVIENDLGPLHGAHVRLAAGVPHFFRQEYLSPLTLENIVATGGDPRSPSALQQQVFYGGRADVWASNAQIASDYTAGQRPAAQPETETAPDGANEDLFLFDAGVMDFAKGARAKILLREAKVRYRDIYTWDMNFDRAAMDCFARSSGNRVPATEEEAKRVWHTLELENNTASPWSTGVASVFRNGQIIAQERLTYTPPGARNELKLTVATDIMNRTTEEEVSRTGGIRKEDGGDYWRVSDKVSMVLTNVKREAVTVRVKRWVYGEVTAAEGAKTQRLALGETPEAWRWGYYWGWWVHLNAVTRVEWEVKLEPGETRTLTAERSYFFR